LRESTAGLDASENLIKDVFKDQCSEARIKIGLTVGWALELEELYFVVAILFGMERAIQ